MKPLITPQQTYRTLDGSMATPRRAIQPQDNQSTFRLLQRKKSWQVRLTGCALDSVPTKVTQGERKSSTTPAHQRGWHSETKSSVCTCCGLLCYDLEMRARDQVQDVVGALCGLGTLRVGSLQGVPCTSAAPARTPTRFKQRHCFSFSN